LLVLVPLINPAFLSNSAHATTQTSDFIKGPTAGHKKIVIFLHGVLGGSVSTWTNPRTGAFWPKLLADDPDFSKYDVYVYGYLSPPFSKASNIQEVALRMQQQLKDQDIFTRYDQIFFITHSAGGLITKRMLDTLNTPPQVQLLKKVRCVLYISVPSNGSDLASVATWLSNNPQFASMSRNYAADFLQAVEADWTELLRERDASPPPFPRTFSAYEKLPTRGVTIVPELYSTQSDSPVIAFDKNHSDMVKPADRSDEVYQWSKARVLEASAVKVAEQARKGHSGDQGPTVTVKQSTPETATPKSILTPSIESSATAQQVLAWGQPLLRKMEGIFATYNADYAAAIRRRDASATLPGTKYNFWTVDIRATQNYLECCASDAIRYREALLQRLPGGSKSSNIAPLYEIMTHAMEPGYQNVPHSGGTLIRLILEDLQRLTWLVEKPFADLSDEALITRANKLSAQLRTFGEQKQGELKQVKSTEMADKFFSSLRDEYTTRFSHEAITLRSEMLSRLPVMPHANQTEFSYKEPVNVWDILEIADDLTKLGNKLRDQSTMQQ
jgi:hypothetical protein